MSATDVQVRFAAEFALFLVSLAGLGFMFLRADLLVRRPVARVAAAAGFAALAAAAFCSGALIVDSPTTGAVVGLRLIGIGCLVLTARSWVNHRGSRTMMAVGVIALLLAEASLVGESPGLEMDLARGLGALALGAALVAASTRAISARIASSAAAILFAVITVLAVALSAVITDNVEDEAIRRYGARAATEAQVASEQGVTALGPTQLLASALESTSTGANREALARITDPAVPVEVVSAERGLVEGLINAFVTSFLRSDPRLVEGEAFVIDANGRVVATYPAVDPAVATEVAGSRVIRQALLQHDPTQSVVVVGGRPLALAADPLVLPDLGFRGVVVLSSSLDDAYLNLRTTLLDSEQAGTGVALVDREQLLASAGVPLAVGPATSLAQAAMDNVGTSARNLDDRFAVARPVLGSDGAPVMAMVLSAPRTQIEAAREDLYRVLFLVAMGAAAAALALASMVGERIGSGLRRITVAAQAIREGNLEATAGVTTDDELGVLGSSFDSMAGSLRAMTDDLRLAADEEAELRTRLEAVVAGMGDALVAVDATAHITDFNAAAEELCDLLAADARGRLVTDVVRFVGDDGTDQSARLSRPVLESWTEPGNLVQASGREVAVVVSAGTLRGPGNDVHGAVFVLRDVRRERELERMKTEFLANISHELRTPLTPIKGFASILHSRDLPSERVHGFAGEIGDAADQMERVIAQLVNFATVVGGRLSLDPEPLAPRSVLDEAVRHWRDRVDGSHTLSRRVAAGTPAIVADRAYLRQSLDELIDNAIKYSPSGGKIVVGAGVHETEDGKPMMRVYVRDNGVGIPADRLGSIFEDFSQVDASATRRFGGLGLGLALVHRIVRAHDGELTCDSELGKGSTFSMLLPLDQPDAKDPS